MSAEAVATLELVILEQMLPTVWQLTGADVPALAGHGRDQVIVVADVEHLCAAVVVAGYRSDAPYAGREHVELEDALAYLLGRVVELLPRYDPGRGRRRYDPWTDGFRAWLHRELSRDLIDRWRSVNGRQGQKRSLPLPEWATGTHEDFDDLDRRNPMGRERRRAPLEAPYEPIEDGFAALLRGCEQGEDRATLGAVKELGLSGARARGSRRRAAAA